jgi:hypothetical protein
MFGVEGQNRLHFLVVALHGPKKEENQNTSNNLLLFLIFFLFGYGVLMICINTTSEVDAVLENAAHFTTASALSRSCHANHFGLLWPRCNQPK